jgi:NADPH-dependent curcumin reductase CurA
VSFLLHCSLVWTDTFYRFDYVHQYKQALAEMAEWLADGSLQRKYHIVDGLQNAPAALPMLFNGGNTGKLYVALILSYFRRQILIS